MLRLIAPLGTVAAAAAMLVVTPVAAQDSAPPQVQEFGFNGPPFNVPRGGDAEKFPNQRITGRLFSPLVDDSAWCDIEVEYQVLTEGAGEGTSSQRIILKRLGKPGQLQFGLRNFPLKEDEEIRLRFLARSADYTPVAVEVRQAGPPYSTYYKQAIQPVPEWREFEVLIPGGFFDPQARINFVVTKEGVLDFDHLRIERRVAEALKIPQERLANLLPSSSFPLGAAPPWYFHGFGKVEVNPELRGATGAPAVVLDVRKQPGYARFEQSIRMGFRALPKKNLTVRVSANLLEGEGEISVRAGVEEIWKSPFAATHRMRQGWNTYDLNVELPQSARGYYQLQIAFEGQMKVAVDRVQAAQDGKPFALTGPLEVVMNSTVPYGLVQDDEPVEIELAAYGQLDAAAGISLTLHDFYGNKVSLGRFPVPDEAYVPVRTTLEIPEDFTKFGSFRVEAQPVKADGSPVGVPAEVLVHRVRGARFGTDLAPQSFFGIHYYTSHLDAEGLQVLKKLGFNWVRLFKTFTWSRIEGQKGQYDFAQTDRDVELLKQFNMNALGILGTGAPAWAAKNRDPEFKGWACWTPRDPNEFADFTAKVFERYGDVVTAYEPWNEPYYPGFFTEKIVDGKRVMGPAKDYVTIQKLVYERAKGSGKKLQIGWNTNTLLEIERTKEWLELGILPYVDFISLHHYLGQPDPAPEITQQIQNLKDLLGPKAATMPIWNSEGGLGPFTAFNLYRNVPPIQDDNHQVHYADWYVRYYLACLAGGLKHFFVYLWSAPNFWMPDYSINNVDGRISANLTAISALAWQVDGLNFASTEQISEERGKVHVFTGETRSVGTVVPAFGRTFKVPEVAGVTAYDLFGNVLKPGTEQARIFYLQTEGASAEPIKQAVGKL